MYFKVRKAKSLIIENDFYKIVDDIVENKKSVARFGDGELRLMINIDPIGYQKPNEKLAKKLQETLADDSDNIAIGLMYAIKNYDSYVFEAKYFFAWFNYKFFDKIFPYINKNNKYINASFTRIYLKQNNKKEAGKKFKYIKKIWDGRDVIFVEGQHSKLGVGNDLFDNVKSIKRILGPAEEAFDSYDEILKVAKKQDKDVLFILALGAAATVLARDLAKCGYQALDLGHIDIEYEWYKNNATEPIAIKGKYTNEITSNEKVQGTIIDNEYEKSIIAKIGIK